MFLFCNDCENKIFSIENNLQFFIPVKDNCGLHEVFNKNFIYLCPVIHKKHDKGWNY